ncbi:MFS transporter [Sphingobium sp. HBC34]|uniref:MFS transporter n=1 Tax=Sphingobium cyanobacteriorum TaxID=3063954 RepID=A0ABT8ZGF3_9SPHN|nr:MFS transporter [Sphingobium sp. HBC34]MDO7833476.1 MFS transporter [Sphingobium sp. HBC34]
MPGAATLDSPPMPSDDWANLAIPAKGALALAGTFIAVGLFTLGAALPPLQADFATAPNVGLLIQLIGTIAAPVFALSSPVAGRLVARHGVRSAYLASLALFLAAGLAPILCNSLVAILALRVVLGFAVAGAFTAGMVGIARLPERQRHMMYGLSAFLGGGIAIFAYQIVGSFAAESWRLAFLVHLLLLPAAGLALFLPRNRVKADAPVAQARGAGLLAGVPPQLFLAAIFVGWAMVSSSIYSPFYLAAMGVADPGKIGFVLAIMAMGSLVGSGSYGFVQKFLGTSAMMLLGMAVTATGCAILAVGGTLPVAMIGLGMMGAGLGACGTAVYALAMEAIGASGNSGAATGAVSLALYLPQALFPMASGPLGAAFGPPAVYAMVGGLLATGLCLLVLRPVRR